MFFIILASLVTHLQALLKIHADGAGECNVTASALYIILQVAYFAARPTTHVSPTGPTRDFILHYRLRSGTAHFSLTLTAENKTFVFLSAWTIGLWNVFPVIFILEKTSVRGYRFSIAVLNNSCCPNARSVTPSPSALTAASLPTCFAHCTPMPVYLPAMLRFDAAGDEPRPGRSGADGAGHPRQSASLLQLTTSIQPANCASSPSSFIVVTIVSHSAPILTPP